MSVSMSITEIEALQHQAALAAQRRLDKKARKPWPRFLETIDLPRADDATVAKLSLKGKNNLHSDFRSLQFLLTDNTDGVLTYAAECVRCNGEGTIEVETWMDKHGETIWPPLNGYEQFCGTCDLKIEAAYEAQAAKQKRNQTQLESKQETTAQV